MQLVVFLIALTIVLLLGFCLSYRRRKAYQKTYAKKKGRSPAKVNRHNQHLRRVK